MTTMTVNPPVPVTAPRGAEWAAEAAHLILRLFAKRARPVQADAVRGSPAIRTREAMRVRRLADSLREQDPRFAADLYAAADRHERD